MLLTSKANMSEACGGRGRVGLFECECGCGQTFFATVKTRHPRYANKTHRARAYRARKRAIIRTETWIYSEKKCGSEWFEYCLQTFLGQELEKNRGKM